MNTKHIQWIFAAAILTLASCDVNDPIYDTAHPSHGKITLTTDWSHIGTGLTAPASYTVKVGEYSATVSGVTHTIDHAFAPATYRAHIYNTAEQIAVSGTAVTVAGEATPAGQTGTFVHHMPGWFYSCAMDATIQKDNVQEFTAVMCQQVQEITFTITPSGGTADRIERVTGILSGVAGAMNIDTEQRSAASSVVLNFARQSNGTWSATIRLLGIVGSLQPLTTTVRFTDDNPGEVTNTTDINDVIDGNFGEDGGPVDPKSGGSQPIIDLGTEIIETPTDAGFTCTINDWVKTDRNGTAN